MNHQISLLVQKWSPTVKIFRFQAKLERFSTTQIVPDSPQYILSVIKQLLLEY